MAAEFQESELMFHLEPSQKHVDKKYVGRAELGNIFELHGATFKSEGIFPAPLSSSIESRNDDRKANTTKKMMKKSCKNTNVSVPVNIPDDDKTWLFKYVDEEVWDAEFVPPHVLIGHRVAGKMIPLSVCTGNGRTLKGRDLSDVRNSILRMTGFLET